MNHRSALIVCLFAVLLLISSVASAAKPQRVWASSTDNLQQAMTVTANKSYKITHADEATVQASEPQHDCRAGSLPSVWFRYKADRQITVTFDTSGSHFGYPIASSSYNTDTVMSVYVMPHGNPNAPEFSDLDDVSCSDDAPDGPRHSELTVEVTDNAWYFIRVTPYLLSTPISSEGSFRLNVTASNLLSDADFKITQFVTEWALTGMGAPDDVILCPGGIDCTLVFTHSALGSSTMKQVIDSFGGVKLPVGTSLVLSADMYIGSSEQNFTMKLKVVYTDGTSTTKTGKLSQTRLSDSVVLDTKPLVLTKPVARIIVQLTDKETTPGKMEIDDMTLRAIASGSSAGASALALPLPGAPK